MNRSCERSAHKRCHIRLYHHSIPVRVTSHIRPAFPASSELNLGRAFLYPDQACRMVRGAFPYLSAAAVITSPNGFIKIPPQR